MPLTVKQPQGTLIREEFAAVGIAKTQRRIDSSHNSCSAGMSTWKDLCPFSGAAVTKYHKLNGLFSHNIGGQKPSCQLGHAPFETLDESYLASPYFGGGH